MTDEFGPPRLSKSSDSALERRLAGLVEGSRANVGTAEQLEQLEARLLPLIGPPGPVGSPSPGGGGTATVGATASMKAAAIAVAVVAAAGVGIWLYSARAPAPSPSEHRQSVPAVQTAPTPSVSSTLAPEAPVEAPAVASAPGAEPAPSIGASGTSKDRAPLSEPDLIGQAQAALAGNPARALSLCEKHRKLFPHGVLVQEREVLAIEALEKLGRHAQAVDRGARFLKAFPSSAHRSKIVGIVGSR